MQEREGEACHLHAVNGACQCDVQQCVARQQAESFDAIVVVSAGKEGDNRAGEKRERRIKGKGGEGKLE